MSASQAPRCLGPFPLAPVIGAAEVSVSRLPGIEVVDGETGMAHQEVVMSKTAVILDCYTVEPSGLGVPPYLSAYVREAYSALSRALPGADVRYLTIDDVRWVLNGGVPNVAPPLSDALTYSATMPSGCCGTR